MGKRIKIKSIVGSPCGVLLHLINANREASAVYAVEVFTFFDVFLVEDIQGTPSRVSLLVRN